MKGLREGSFEGFLNQKRGIILKRGHSGKEFSPGPVKA